MGFEDFVRVECAPRLRATALALALAASLAVPGARAHDPYTAWSQPDTGQSCCDGYDCQISRAYNKDGQWMAEFEGEFVAVPPSKVLDPRKVPNPDGNAHLCAQRFDGKIIVYCFRRPEARM